VNERIGPLLRFWAAHGAGVNPIMFAQDFPDGARRAGEKHTKRLHLGILLEKVQDRFWSGHPLQMRGRLIADAHNFGFNFGSIVGKRRVGSR